MTRRIVWRLVFAVAVLIPMIALAVPQATFKAPQGEQTPAKLSITTSTASPLPARLEHVSGNEVLTAEGLSVKVTYTASQLMVEMNAGSLRTFNRTVPFPSVEGTPFKTLYLTLDTGGKVAPAGSSSSSANQNRGSRRKVRVRDETSDYFLRCGGVVGWLFGSGSDRKTH